MLIDLNEVLKNDGRIMSVEAEFTEKIFSSKLGDFPIIVSEPVSLKITNKGNRKLTITGNTKITVAIPCDRCLEDVNQILDLYFEKNADMNQTDEERRMALDEQNTCA